jgi:hypothetical protein
MNINRTATTVNRINDIYQRWLDNCLSSEDTIFQIGDALEALKSVREPDSKEPGAD